MEFNSRKVGNFIFNEAQGKFNITEFSRYIYENYNNWKDNDLVWTLDNVSYDDIASHHMSALSRALQDYFITRVGSKTALVASQEISFGYMRMFEILTERDRVEDMAVFRNVEKAITWLQGKAV